MISVAQTKLIRSLRQKKYRDQSKLYIVEGEKMIGELLSGKGGEGHRLKQLFATSRWIEANQSLLDGLEFNVSNASPDELKKVSNMVTPQPVLGLVTLPKEELQFDSLLNNPVLAFEAIRDPGNLGTIIRTADWFGIVHLVCTPDSVDVFNPKVVQSTMGAITRVKVYDLDIEQLLAKSSMRKKVVYGTFLEGKNIYGTNMEKNPLILFGSESHGLSGRYEKYIKQKIAIPSFSQYGKSSESLNVASSVAVICSELKRTGISNPIRNGNST